MVLSDSKILELIKNSSPKCTLNRNLINPSSIDVRLGDFVKEPKWYWSNKITRFFLSRTNHNVYFEKSRKFTEYKLMPGSFALFHTKEYIEVPIDKCACIFLKSSWGRMGLEHNHSAWIDSGFEGELTLELINEAPFPVILRSGERIAQIVFFEMSGIVVNGYDRTGRYQYQIGATPAKGMNEINYD